MLGLYLTGDLMFSSRATAAARRQNLSLTVVSSPQALVEQASAGSVGLVILDLTLPALDVESCLAELKKLTSPPREIVAYAPHVHAEKLAAAQAAGCGLVLSRGQFDREVDRLLETYLANR